MAIIASITADTIQGVLEDIPIAYEQGADQVEVRIDKIRPADVTPVTLMNMAQHSDQYFNLPVLITARHKDEAGKDHGFREDEQRRRYLLEEAIRVGCDVDIEYKAGGGAISDLIHVRSSYGTGGKVIVSAHDFDGMFEEIFQDRSLKEIYKEMATTGADIVKLIPTARTWEECLDIMNLVSDVSEKGGSIAAFSMGEDYRISRPLSLVYGALRSYAAISKGKKAAPGQLTVSLMREKTEEAQSLFNLGSISYPQDIDPGELASYTRLLDLGE